jgi:hypothetical protein
MVDAFEKLWLVLRDLNLPWGARSINKGDLRMIHLVKLLTFVAVIAVTAMTLGCSGPDASIQKALDTNPKFKEKGITAKVTGSDNGYYTIAVKGFGPKVTKAINIGEDFGTIAMFTSTDIFLVAEMDQILKKRPENELPRSKLRGSSLNC